MLKTLLLTVLVCAVTVEAKKKKDDAIKNPNEFKTILKNGIASWAHLPEDIQEKMKIGIRGFCDEKDVPYLDLMTEAEYEMIFNEEYTGPPKNDEEKQFDAITPEEEEAEEAEMWRGKVKHLLAEYAPHKLKQLKGLFKKYLGREQQLYNDALEKYGPKDDEEQEL